MSGENSFQIAFDVTKIWWPDLWLFSLGVGAGAFAAFLSYLAERPKFVFGLLFMCLWGFSFIGFSLVPFLGLRRDVQNGKCRLYEGIVKNFHAEPYAGHDAEGESFDLNGVHFRYSNYVLSPGYRSVVSHGAVPIAGRVIRICAVGSDIGRLEVRSH